MTRRHRFAERATGTRDTRPERAGLIPQWYRTDTRCHRDEAATRPRSLIMSAPGWRRGSRGWVFYQTGQCCCVDWLWPE